jgi:hypothetical protein
VKTFVSIILIALVLSACATCNEVTMTPEQFKQCELENSCFWYNGSYLYDKCMRGEEITKAEKIVHHLLGGLDNSWDPVISK